MYFYLNFLQLRRSWPRAKVGQDNEGGPRDPERDWSLLGSVGGELGEEHGDCHQGHVQGEFSIQIAVTHYLQDNFTLSPLPS